MSIKVGNLSDWLPLSSSIILGASDDRARRVRLYLNCLEPTPLFVSQSGAPARFLATMPAGLELVEFVASGEVEIAADSLDRVVYYQSTEHEKMWFDGDGASFTTIHERMPRNEALEWVQFQSEQNQKRMEAALRSEMQNHMAALEAKYENTSSGVHGGAAAQHQKPAQAKAAAAPLDGGAPQPNGGGAVQPAPGGAPADEQVGAA
ncbi:MAG: hypothetical protein EOQ98_21845 [Mesorhizobium sp.]|uniref:hypothetical protein n=1 Tax=Mesorhizobium sp. TaxID=1871066 RepID=UPI000FE61DB2|nr:hypothetical protein [Mesorhizobium sp.]RWO96665.1 MAG: hypothetical protein EOQ98_21845 [Mesorhizobium sp.]